MLDTGAATWADALQRRKPGAPRRGHNRSCAADTGRTGCAYSEDTPGVLPSSPPTADHDKESSKMYLPGNRSTKPLIPSSQRKELSKRTRMGRTFQLGIPLGVGLSRCFQSSRTWTLVSLSKPELTSFTVTLALLAISSKVSCL